MKHDVGPDGDTWLRARVWRASGTRGSWESDLSGLTLSRGRVLVRHRSLAAPTSFEPCSPRVHNTCTGSRITSALRRVIRVVG